MSEYREMPVETYAESLCIALARQALLYQTVYNRTWRDGMWRSDPELVTAAYAACCQLHVWNPPRWVKV